MSEDPAAADRARAEDSARARAAKEAAWSSLTRPRLSRSISGSRSSGFGASRSSGVGGVVGDLLLEIALAVGVHALWPLLARWMSFRRAAALIAGIGVGMLWGALVIPRWAFPAMRDTDGSMVGPLLTGEVASITLALLLLVFGGGMIALLAGQRRQLAASAGADRGDSPADEPVQNPPIRRESVRGSARASLMRGVRWLELVAIAASWMFAVSLLTCSFFYADPVTVAEHVAGEEPGSVWSHPVAVQLVLGTLIALTVAVVAGRTASNVSSTDR
ncbi:hypothetical protein [Brachybacterium tyrofermentans]|uniref:Uncharacterized protein n=2 Tax=Brachybacterium tyrofermentans TaxID=47848 RepID=A0ABW0FDG1_9MICO|nr:hypothetical protein [Brachybacterium tyrofermentans]